MSGTCRSRGLVRRRVTAKHCHWKCILPRMLQCSVAQRSSLVGLACLAGCAVDTAPGWVHLRGVTHSLTPAALHRLVHAVVSLGAKGFYAFLFFSLLIFFRYLDNMLSVTYCQLPTSLTSRLYFYSCHMAYHFILVENTHAQQCIYAGTHTHTHTNTVC